MNNQQNNVHFAKKVKMTHETEALDGTVLSPAANTKNNSQELFDFETNAQHFLTTQDYLVFANSNTRLATGELNKLANKTALGKITDMLLCTPYNIKYASRQPTKYGSRVLLQLEEFIIYLPPRFDNLSDEAVAAINTEKDHFIVYEGMRGRQYRLSFVNQ